MNIMCDSKNCKYCTTYEFGGRAIEAEGGGGHRGSTSQFKTRQELRLEGGITANVKLYFRYSSLGKCLRPKRVDGNILLWLLKGFREAQQCTSTTVERIRGA
jgi:hypothetical protein